MTGGCKLSSVDPAIRLLRDLVAINSVNPTLVPGAPGEAQIADAVAAEMRSFGLDSIVGHKGFSWIDIEVAGRAAHGSRPAEGQDAILRMGRVLRHLEALDRDLQAREPNALLGTGSLHASIIDGGRELSSYPDR